MPKYCPILLLLMVVTVQAEVTAGQEAKPVSANTNSSVPATPTSAPTQTSAPAATPASAPLQYITDRLNTGLRAGAAKEQKVINTINAGEAVTVLDRAPGTGFVRVRAQSGPEGWVEADKVVANAPAVTRYADLDQRYQIVKRELEELNAATPEREALQQKMDVMQKQVVELENQNDKLVQQNALLEHRFQSEVMYSGAFIVLIGLALGWIIGAFKNRRRDAWH